MRFFVSFSDFCQRLFSVEFSDVVETVQALRVPFICEIELRGLNQEERHEEEQHQRKYKYESTNVEPILNPGNHRIQHDLSCSPE